MKRPPSTTPAIASSMRPRSGSSGVLVSKSGTAMAVEARGGVPRLAATMSIGIVGLGYVGLPLAVAYAEEGHDVVALDVDSRKVEAIREGRSYVEDIPSERLQAVAERIRPTTRPAALAGTEVIAICVPTPLTANREPDLGPLLD